METVYIVLPFVVFIINTFLAALVLKSDWRTSRNQVFAAFLAAMALWGLTIFGMRSSPNPEVAAIWERFVLAVIPFTGVFFYHFTLAFTGSRSGRWLFRAFYVLGALAAVLSMAGFAVDEMVLKWYGYAPVLGPTFFLSVAVAYIPAIVGLGVLFRASRRSRAPDDRNRNGYIILGVASLLVGGTTDYLPALGVNIYPMGIVSLIFFGALAIIAVTRYRLMDLRVLLRRGFAYSVVSTGIFAVYGLILWLFLTIFQYQTATASVVATAAAILLVTMVLPPTVAKAQGLVDRLFDRERYDHLVALQRFTQETHEIGDFTGLADSLVKTTSLAMHAHWVTLLLPDPDTGDFVPVGDGAGQDIPELSVRRNSPVARYLDRHAGSFTAWDLEVAPYLQAMGDAERQRLRAAGAQLFVGLPSKSGLTGVLVLGPKLTDEDYSRSAVDLLTTVAYQTATMIENSRLYSQEMARLRELEQLESLKSNLLMTVSHELKSPITAIRASVDLFAEARADLGERGMTRVARTLRNGVDRLDRLVQESLDYAQMQTAQLELHMEPTDIRAMVEESVALISPTANAKHQNLTVDVPDGLPMLLMDTPRIERILVNLLSNAAKFTPAEGSIALTVATVEQNIVVQLSDTGLGIPEEDQKHLFTEFYRGSNADGQRNAGTGLGLAIAKYLAEMHGGKIGVESKVGEGTTFTLTLPLIPALEEDLQAQNG